MAKRSCLSERRGGFTLIEVIVVVLLAAIPTLVIGLLLSGSSRLWQNIHNDARSGARQDAYAALASLQSFGRQANLTHYTVYKITGSNFIPATPLSGQTTAVGQAAEFWYWDDKFNPASPGTGVLEVENTGTHYVLYYLDGRQLKADFGTVVGGVGGVKNNSRYTANLLSTQVLSQFVDTQENINIFNHQTSGGAGNGCVNTDMTLTDNDNISVEVKFSTLIRSAWPR